MKKLLAFSVCAAVLLSLAGCQKKFEEPVDESIQDAPAYVAGIYNQMNDLAKKHNLSFRALNYSDIALPEFGILRAEVGESGNTARNPYVQFWEDSERGFQVIVRDEERDKERPQVLKDVVTASVMITDSTLSLEDAKAKMEELCGSRPTASSESRYGKVVESGDFKLWFSMDSDKESESFYVVKKDAMFLWYEEKSAYKELNKSVAEQAKWESGNRYKVTAKVDDFILSNWKDYSSSKVTGSDGQSYIVAYDYGKHPVQFETGKTYTFYGTVSSPAATVGNDVLFTEIEGRQSVEFPILSLDSVE